MATLNDNPFKRFKKALKGTKADGMKAHEMAKHLVRRKGANWIAGAIKKPGALHKEMGVPEGKKIPAGKLRVAAGKGGKLGQRARLAETLKGMKHRKRKASKREEPTVNVGMEGDVEHKKSHKKRKSTIGFDDVESKKSKRKKSAMCMKCKSAHEKHEAHEGKK